MPYFLPEAVLQLSELAIGIFLPLTIALPVVGFSLANKGILKFAFFSAIILMVLYALIFAGQFWYAGGYYSIGYAVIGVLRFILLQIAIGVVVVTSYRRFKKIA